MDLIVDANILFSALIVSGNFEEFEKYKTLLLKKNK